MTAITVELAPNLHSVSKKAPPPEADTPNRSWQAEEKAPATRKNIVNVLFVERAVMTGELA
jgi:hypothetical protein